MKGNILSAERLGLIVLQGGLVQLSEKFQNNLLYFQFQNIKGTWKLLEILRFRFLSKNIAMSQQVPGQFINSQVLTTPNIDLKLKK